MKNEDLPTGPVEGGTSVVVAGSGLSELDIDLHLNSVCDAFESGWQTGQRPQLADFLTDTRLPVSTLFVELVQIEMEYRRRTGEQVSLEEYVVRYPEFSEALSKLAPSLDTVSMPAPREAPTTALGRFELVAPLGQGTFGVVWKARDTKLRRWVAIKRLRETSPSASRDLFAREARAVQKLDHPNVVRLLELSQGATTDYIVFEYVEGRTLKEILGERNHTPLDPDRAARIALQLANGLQHIHQRGLIHRDLKPANVMITPAGEAKILDFGLARHTDTTSTIGGGQGFLGTIPYMSPEQLRGGKTVTQQSDIYALGTIFYEMLAGHRPFDGSQDEILANIPKGNPPRFDGPETVQTIVRRAMDIDPIDRYSSATAIAEDLQRYLTGAGPRRRIPNIGKKVAAGIGRRKFLTGLAGGAGLAACCAPFLVPSTTIAKGKVLVDIKTEPIGAAIVCIPLDSRNGQPLPAAKIEASKVSPVALELDPGDYLVVVYLKDDPQRFHEVYRHVPLYPGNTSGVFPHLGWRPVARQHVSWPTIRIPEPTCTIGMVKVEEFASVPLSGKPDGDRLSVPSFWVSPTEYTVADYKADVHKLLGKSADFNKLQKLKKQQCDACPFNCNFDEAMARAEGRGLRLLHEWEYHAVTTQGGRTRFSWGNALPEGTVLPTDKIPAGEPSFDELHLPDGSIFGLSSNVAEWVDSYSLINPTHGHFDEKPIPGPSHMRVVCGPRPADIAAIQSKKDITFGKNVFLSSREDRDQVKPYLGFRCARSIRPRLTDLDFPNR